MYPTPAHGFDQTDPRPRDNLGRFLPHDGTTFEPLDDPFADEPSVDDEDDYDAEDADEGEDYGDDADTWDE